MKYSISYTSGATGYGWDHECETITEVERIISDLRKEITAAISVFDKQLNDFIFWKRALCPPDKDMIWNGKRDLRTVNREKKTN